MAEPADLEDRDRARLRLGANVVVEAGAGTGKTTLLTDRILFSLLGPSATAPSIADVVALTFTEKAAGEIKLRLSERLAELAAALEGGETSDRARQTLAELQSSFGRGHEDAARRARAALEDMDKAQIGTIHAFASHLLRTFPLEAGVDPGFKVDEGPRFDGLFAEEWARWLDAELGENPRQRERWLEILQLASLEDLEDLARELCRERFDLEGLGEPDPSLAEQLERLARQVEGLGEGQGKPRGRSKIHETLGKVSARLAALAAAVRELEPAPPDALTAEEIGDAKWPAGWDPGRGVLYEQAVKLAASSSPAEEALLRRALRLLVPFARDFRRTYSKAGLVSFDGLLRKARDLLRDRPEARRELKSRYACLLIDEFQDTDPLQGELLLFLAEAEGSTAGRWQDAALAPGRLFVVGDPKQSIYRFRGADISAYQSFTERVLESPGALACGLSANFRSPASILGPVNEIFEKLMSAEAGLQPAYRPLTSAVEGGQAGSVSIVSIEKPRKESRPFDAEAVQGAEAAWITRWVLGNCGPGKRWRYRDAAVLLRTSTPLGALLEAFKAAGVPYAVEVEKYFYGAQEVQDFLNVLKALDDPEDRVALAGLLRSGLVGLEDAALYRLAQAEGLSYLKEPPKELGARDRERLQCFFGLMRRLRERVGRVPLSELVRAILDETPLLEIAARAYHEVQSVSNLLKFKRLAAEASEGEGLTLREFIERVAKDIREAREEGESPLADEHLEAVRVMTIHKAKGLEFPVVFLMNASGRLRGGAKAASLLDWGSGRTGFRLLGASAASVSMAWLEAQEAVRQDREALRLLYVAMTRAKERLFILGKDSGDKNAFSTRLAAAGAWPTEESGDELKLGDWKVPVERVPADADLLERKSREASVAAEKLPAARSLGAIWKRRQALWEETAGLAWTRRPTDYLAEREKDFIAEEGAPPLVGGGGALVGRLCHKVLEGWDYKTGGDLKKALARSRKSLERACPSSEWDAACAEAESVLAKFLASAAAEELASCEILGREIPFVYGDAGTVVRGSIDLLYRRHGKAWVADYKTEAASSKDLSAKREKYALQGKAYCEAVGRAWGIKDVGFRLLFLRSPELCREG